MLRPHEELPAEIAKDKSFMKVFLAGTIDMGNSVDWQTVLFETFSGMNGIPLYRTLDELLEELSLKRF